MSFDLQTLLAYVSPAVAVYVGIRVDIATLKVRLDNLERQASTTTKGAHHG